MKAEDLLGKLLEIDSPWQIVRVRDDLGKKQVDVWVARQEGKGNWLFGPKVASVCSERECVWRHVNLGDTRCLIHAESSGEVSATSWAGAAGQPFTNAMSRRIVGMMRDGIRLQNICSMLDISVGDLWKFKHGLDSGTSGLVVPATTAQSDIVEDVSRVPEPDSSVWAGLLDGSIVLDIRLLSLRLLLTKMREQMRVITDPEVQILKCYELQRFFVRYEKALAPELDQIEALD